MLNPITKATEREMTLALKERHRKRGDYFGSQVKMGSAGNMILDGVAIPITWSPITIIGYEIKSSRADFLSDQKFPQYMTTCNLFSFVVPKGLIKKEEVPARVGILEYSKKTGKLRQLKRPVYEPIEINAEMLLHCIFYKLEEYKKPKTKQEYLEDIKTQVKRKEYGSQIADKIKNLERKIFMLESLGKRDEWAELLKDLKEDYGIDIKYKWQLKPYIDINNKKYNKAVELLEESSKLFKEVDEEDE